MRLNLRASLRALLRVLLRAPLRAPLRVPLRAPLRATSALALVALLGGGARGAWAQEAPPGEGQLGGGARGTAAVELGAEWEVIVNAADIHGGPSTAYKARGRVFLGERVTGVQVSANQEWVQVSTQAGAQGWVRSAALKNPRQALAQDPGRFRRQAEYEYDAQGRRVTAGGAMAGSGEGAGAPARPAAPPPAALAAAPERGEGGAGGGGGGGGAPGAAPTLVVALSPLGGAQTSYRFASDVRFASPLARTETSALGYQSSLRAQYQPLSLLRLTLHVSDARLGSVDVGAHPRRPDLAPALKQVGSSQTSGALRADVGAWLGGAWLGLTAGAHLLTQSFRAITYAPPYSNYRPLLDRTYLSGAAGLALTAPLGPLTLSASGGALLPMSLKTDLVVGAWEGLGFWADAALSLPLTDLLSLGLYAQWTRLGIDIKTLGQYADPFYADLLGGYAAGYTRASASDGALGGGALAEMRF